MVVTSFIEVMSTGEEELISGKTYTCMSNTCVHRTHQVAGSRRVCVMHQLVGSDHRLCHFSKMCRIPHQRLSPRYIAARNRRWLTHSFSFMIQNASEILCLAREGKGKNHYLAVNVISQSIVRALQVTGNTVRQS